MATNPKKSRNGKSGECVTRWKGSVLIAPTIFDKAMSKKIDIKNLNEVETLFKTFLDRPEATQKNTLPAIWQDPKKASFLILDFDKQPQGSINKALRSLKNFNLYAILYTTTSHGKDGKESFRIYVPVSPEIPNESQYRLAGEKLFDNVFLNQGLSLDETCLQITRGMYGPTKVQDRPKPILHVIEGVPFDYQKCASGKTTFKREIKEKSKKSFIIEKDGIQIDLVPLWNRISDRFDIVSWAEKNLDVLGKRPRGGLHVVCPNVEEHTTGDQDKDKACFVDNRNGDSSAKIHCLHDHCKDKTTAEFLYILHNQGYNLSEFIEEASKPEIHSNVVGIDGKPIQTNVDSSPVLEKVLGKINKDEWSHAGNLTPYEIFKIGTDIYELTPLSFWEGLFNFKGKEFREIERKYVVFSGKEDIDEIREGFQNVTKKKKIRKLSKYYDVSEQEGFYLSAIPPKNKKDFCGKLLYRSLVSELRFLIETGAQNDSIAHLLYPLCGIYGISFRTMQKAYAIVLISVFREQWVYQGNDKREQTILARTQKLLSDLVVFNYARSFGMKDSSHPYAFGMRNLDNKKYNTSDPRDIVMSHSTLQTYLGSSEWEFIGAENIPTSRMTIHQALTTYPFSSPIYTTCTPEPFDRKDLDNPKSKTILEEIRYGKLHTFMMPKVNKPSKEKLRILEKEIFPVIKHVLAKDDDNRWDFILSFMAHIHQYPWKKPSTGLFFLGPQGNGKSTSLKFLAVDSLNKDLAVVSSSSEIVTSSGRNVDFNASWAGKLSVFIDEFSDFINMQNNEAMKMLITGETTTIRRKFMDSVTIKNPTRFVFAANETKMILPKGERRITVFETGTDTLSKTSSFWKKHVDNMRVCRKTLTWYLQNYEPIGGFNRIMSSMQTPEKRKMQMRQGNASSALFLEWLRLLQKDNNEWFVLTEEELRANLRSRADRDNRKAIPRNIAEEAEIMNIMSEFKIQRRILGIPRYIFPPLRYIRHKGFELGYYEDKEYKLDKKTVKKIEREIDERSKS